jgi:hypothetical protein
MKKNNKKKQIKDITVTPTDLINSITDKSRCIDNSQSDKRYWVRSVLKNLSTREVPR